MALCLSFLGIGPVQKALTVITTVVVIGAPAALGTGLWRDGKFAAGLARGVITGVILGSNVWPHQPGLSPADVKLRILASGYETTAISLAN
jgi:hypothetical protein